MWIGLDFLIRNKQIISYLDLASHMACAQTSSAMFYRLRDDVTTRAVFVVPLENQVGSCPKTKYLVKKAAGIVYTGLSELPSDPECLWNTLEEVRTLARHVNSLVGLIQRPNVMYHISEDALVPPKYIAPGNVAGLTRSSSCLYLNNSHLGAYLSNLNNLKFLHIKGNCQTLSFPQSLTHIQLVDTHM